MRQGQYDISPAGIGIPEGKLVVFEHGKSWDSIPENKLVPVHSAVILNIFKQGDCIKDAYCGKYYYWKNNTAVFIEYFHCAEFIFDVCLIVFF